MAAAMRNNARAAAILVFLLVPAAMISAHLATAQQASSQMTIRQIRRAVITGIKGADKYPVKSISNIKVSEKYLAFDVDQVDASKVFRCFETGRYQVDLTSLGVLTVGPWGKKDKNDKKDPLFVLYMDGTNLKDTVFNFGVFKAGFSKTYCGNHPNILGTLSFPKTEKAQAFADAMNRLSFFARGGGKAQEELEWRDFQQKAAAWRALVAKPPLPEDARQERVLAENAFREKQLDSAIEHYEDALDIFPVWPEGQFNVALLYAELNQYPDAIEHMRAYLELLPDAPDAQASRDQMLIWQDKLKQQANN